MQPTAERPRHPVLRTGARDPIDPYKRRLIYMRDGYSCGWCGLHVEPDCAAPGSLLQLDHIKPWSVYGSDRSDNLRTLCGPCNEQRSNFVEEHLPRLIGVTRQCWWCFKEYGDPRMQLPRSWWDTVVSDINLDEFPRISAFCGRCETTSWVPDEGWIL